VGWVDVEHACLLLCCLCGLGFGWDGVVIWHLSYFFSGVGVTGAQPSGVIFLGT
jgi:hypothetical protein